MGHGSESSEKNPNEELRLRLRQLGYDVQPWQVSNLTKDTQKVLEQYLNNLECEVGSFEEEEKMEGLRPQLRNSEKLQESEKVPRVKDCEKCGA